MGTNIGGYLRGPWWRYVGSDDEKTRRCFVVAWGNIVKDPKTWFTDKRSVQFVIKTGRGAGRNEKHLVCVGYGEWITTAVMEAMEKGDVIFAAGTWREQSYRNKKGENAMQYKMTVNFIVPLGLIGLLSELMTVSLRMTMGLPKFLYGLYQDDRLRQIAEKNVEIDDEADPWESD